MKMNMLRVYTSTCYQKILAEIGQYVSVINICLLCLNYTYPRTYTWIAQEKYFQVAKVVS